MKILIIFALYILSPSLYANAADIRGKVIRVLDGDTIDILQNKKSVRIRLANIDAPEKKQAYGRWSTDQLKSLIAGQSVRVTYSHNDRYGRIIGRVFTTGGSEANRFMVQSGAAWVYEHYNTDNALADLQQEARSQNEVCGLTPIPFHRGNGDISIR